MVSMACLVLIETDDPVITEYEKSIQTVEGTKALRQAVIDSLPFKVTRVIHVMPEDVARLLSMAHEHAMAALGQGRALHPPEGYVGPADRGH